MDKIKSFIQQRPVVAVVIAAVVGGVLALSFGAVARLLRPIAQAVPGSKA